jgi:signal peptidase II
MLGVAALGVLADQATKHWALEALPSVAPDDYNWFGGLLRFRLAFNSGAAFGMGSNSTMVFSVLSLVAGLALLVFCCMRLRLLWQGALAGVLLAGIVGNLIDRLTREPGPFRGLVVDFIALKWFAVFNVADIFITCGAIALGLLAIIAERRKVDMLTWEPR